MGRWLPFAVAALSTALLAGGFGFAVNQLVTPGAQPPPQLKTVSSTTLNRLGLTLSSPTQPPYCGLTDTAVRNGWLRPGTAGCAIIRPVAEAAARQGGRARVIESVLALITSNQPSLLTSTVLHDHLAWVVVTQSAQTACPLTAGYSICFGPRGGWNQLVLVDAQGGRIIGTHRLSPAGWAPGQIPRGGSTVTG